MNLNSLHQAGLELQVGNLEKRVQELTKDNITLANEKTFFEKQLELVGQSGEDTKTVDRDMEDMCDMDNMLDTVHVVETLIKSEDQDSSARENELMSVKNILTY